MLTLLVDLYHDDGTLYATFPCSSWEYDPGRNCIVNGVDIEFPKCEADQPMPRNVRVYLENSLTIASNVLYVHNDQHLLYAGQSVVIGRRQMTVYVKAQVTGRKEQNRGF